MTKTLPILLALGMCATAANANPYAVESAIYKIEVTNPNSRQMGIGTGVLVAQDKILTNCHVMKKNPGWPRVVHRKTGQQFAVTKYYNLGNYDACILVGAFEGEPVRFQTEIVKDENVWIFGFPADIPVIGRGTVIGMVDTDSGKSLKLNAFCAGGSSGGPVVNVKGEFIGLNWGVFQYQNQCLAIPALFLKPYLTAN